MTPAPLRLKHRSGWFAAGEEVVQALEILSAEAFGCTFTCACMPNGRPGVASGTRKLRHTSFTAGARRHASLWRSCASGRFACSQTPLR